MLAPVPRLESARILLAADGFRQTCKFSAVRMLRFVTNLTRLKCFRSAASLQSSGFSMGSKSRVSRV